VTVKNLQPAIFKTFMQRFISCDWGTSSLRIRLVDAYNLSVLAETRTNQGIAATYELWQRAKLNEEKRLSFYQSVIADKIKEFEKKLSTSLNAVPVILSGMASSSLGMHEMPYHILPFSTDGSDLLFEKIPADVDFNHDIIMISGVKSRSDVMRGEETQLVGCDINPREERIFVFPGTHSKHILVSSEKAVSCKTFMTGEFLYLLSAKSILASSVAEHDDIILAPFEAGLMESLHSNLLHSCFTIRTNQLFGRFSRQENHDYLKGLLIGTELSYLVGGAELLTVVSNESVGRQYQAAIKILKIGTVELQDVERATLVGHKKILALAGDEK
jgi:2-dehydro-3-deoxygalactonokinase